MAAKKSTTRSSRSGTTWTEADYKAHGYGQIKVRLPADALELLELAAERAELTRARMLERLIRQHCKSE